jgi:uncharacterized protein (DUF58 family)
VAAPRLRTIGLACVEGLVVAVFLRSQVLMFATLAACALAALVVASRNQVFTAFSYERFPARRVAPWGSDLEIVVRVTNDKILPLIWLRVRDRWPSCLEPIGFALWPPTPQRTRAFVQTVSVRWYERLHRRYRVRCTARGVYHFGPVVLEAGDPFGIAGVTRTFAAHEELVVVPRVLHMPDLDLVTGHPLVEQPAVRSLARDSTTLSGTRPYSPGDSMRAVNWRATARLGALCTNEFEPTSLAAVRILLDVGGTERSWEARGAERNELLCVVAASLASAFDARGFGVGLASNAQAGSDRGSVDVEPQQGALTDVLETLGRIRLFPAAGFEDVLSAELDDRESRSDCVIVTGSLRTSVRERVARLREDRPTRIVYVGRPSPDERSLVDAVVSGDLDWRTSHALPLGV